MEGLNGRFYDYHSFLLARNRPHSHLFNDAKTANSEGTILIFIPLVAFRKICFLQRGIAMRDRHFNDPS